MSASIQTTHVGSLPRPEAVLAQLFSVEDGEHVDQGVFDRIIGDAVAEIVARQIEVGIDLVSDGEMSKMSYATYIKDRLTGFAGDTPLELPADLEQFPSLLRGQIAAAESMKRFRRPRCVGEIQYKSLELLNDDVRRLKAALSLHPAPGAFVNAASPGVIALFQGNDFYATEDDYLEALAEAMRLEYEAIVAAGLMLQIDSPDLGSGRHTIYKDRSEAEYVVLIERHVDVLNHALRNIDAASIRMHVCWGNYEGPHTCDVEMSVILPVLMKAKPAGLLFETANPRHQHDWRAFADRLADIPEDKILIPGVIDTTTNFVEHPQVVAQRLEQFVHMVGLDRVIAGTDCGFGTFASDHKVNPDIAYAKLGAMVEGAALVSRRFNN